MFALCRPTRPGRRHPPLVLVIAVVALVSLMSACSSDDATAELATVDEADPNVDQGSDGADEVDTESTDGAGDTPEGFFGGAVTVVIPNSPGTVSTSGPQRIMTALLGEGPNAYLGGPDQAVTVRYAALDAEVTGDVPGSWLTTDASPLGLYVAPYDFEQAGLWEVTVLADGREIGGTLIEVVEESQVPNIGDTVPASATPTATTLEEVAAISTDPDPDLAFYDLSLDDAVANGRPTVVAFATPAFCRTALCGPTLDTVKEATAGRDELDVVHVEPFDLELAPQGQLEPLPVMFEWGLLTEPWVFVLDADGRVTASFEGIIGLAELTAALDNL